MEAKFFAIIITIYFEERGDEAKRKLAIVSSMPNLDGFLSKIKILRAIVPNLIVRKTLFFFSSYFVRKLRLLATNETWTVCVRNGLTTNVYLLRRKLLLFWFLLENQRISHCWFLTDFVSFVCLTIDPNYEKHINTISLQYGRTTKIYSYILITLNFIWKLNLSSSLIPFAHFYPARLILVTIIIIVFMKALLHIIILCRYIKYIQQIRKM